VGKLRVAHPTNLNLAVSVAALRRVTANRFDFVKAVIPVKVHIAFAAHRLYVQIREGIFDFILYSTVQ
jgi:hypothetical protein